VHQLPPWCENIGKRQVRSPKVYVADSGILHALLGVASRDALPSRPKVGASWEGFLTAQVVARLAARPEQCFHWSTHGGAALDLLVAAGERRYGFEMKRAESPRLTASMRSCHETLKLARLDVVHAGTQQYWLAEGIRALPAAQIATALEPLDE